VRPTVVAALALGLALPACGHGPPVPRYSLPSPPEAGKAPGMKVQRLSDDGPERHYAVIFAAGDDVLSGLSEVARDEKLAASQITAIGGVREATLGWFDRDRKMFREIPVDQAEVTSLVGDVALAGDQPVVHVHANLALSDGTTRGGHVLHAVVWPTLEVLITESPRALHKQADPATGIELIMADGTR
jgi:predicted DNA-binding protein with PD1-like motif